MDIYLNLATQSFARNFRGAQEVSINLTQNNDTSIRLYLLQPSRSPISGFPFQFDPTSGDPSYQAIISLRDVSGFPVTLCSTQPLTAIRNGFSGILSINTQGIANFLAGRAERECVFCLDLVDGGSGYKTSPFRKSIVLRALDLGTAPGTPPTILGFYYRPEITGLSGGGAANADGIASFAFSLGSVFMFVVNGSGSQWRLESGTAATNLDAGIIKLLDTGLNLVRVEGL
ncbi:MAG TPA: hypothetical protein VF345_10920 [Chthoniobacterales bacterium]